MSDNKVILLQLKRVSFFAHIVSLVLVLISASACLFQFSSHITNYVFILAIV